MSDLKVTDRRWWAREDGASPAVAEEPKLKPTYVEELESRLAAKDAELQQLIAKYRSAADEFDQARARLRKEVSRDVERGRRSLIVNFLEVLDNLDRALASANGDRASDPPRRFLRITIHFHVSGAVPQEAVERAVALSHERYCSVWHSMRQDIAFLTSFEIHP